MILAAGERIAVFGGSFDPPHASHVLLGAYVLCTAPIDRMIVVPTWQHALDKKASASFEDRRRMCELAFADMARVEVSTIEQELEGRSYTLNTLEALAERYQGASLRLVLGADILGETHRWHRFDRVAELAPPIIVGRVGYPPPEGEGAAILLPEVSSTDVRARVTAGLQFRGLVPASVADYIDSKGLYRTGEDGA